MQISQYISELLFRYDCVVVPGFGAFLSERVSAKIDKNSGEFFLLVNVFHLMPN